MKREIGQDDKTVFQSGNGCSVSLIFNNLAGKDFKGGKYSDYAAFIAIPCMGFTYGGIE